MNFEPINIDIRLTTASEAKELKLNRDKTVSKEMIKTLDSEIRSACDSGKAVYQFYFKDSLHSEDVKLGIIALLEKNGYKVTRNKGHDQREGDSWDYITIQW